MGCKMEYRFDNVIVKLVDTSSNNERKKKLEKPLQDFFRAVEKEKHEKKVKTVNRESTNDH